VKGMELWNESGEVMRNEGRCDGNVRWFVGRRLKCLMEILRGLEMFGRENGRLV
jgi:hypothetical protein